MVTLSLDEILSNHFSKDDTYTECLISNEPNYDYSDDSSNNDTIDSNSYSSSSSSTSSNINNSIHISFTDVFNTCDMREIQNMFRTNCIRDLFVCYIYHGVHNPYGSHRLELFGHEATLEFWEKLFHSVPDAVFNLTSDSILRTYSSGARVISSDFEYLGTKVYELSVDTNNFTIYSQNHIPEDLTSDGLDTEDNDDQEEREQEESNENDSWKSSVLHKPKKFKTDNIHYDSFSDISSITDTYSEWDSNTQKFKKKELLLVQQGSNSEPCEVNEIDLKLLDKSARMCAKGKMIIFINKEGLIYSIQFHHTAII